MTTLASAIISALIGTALLGAAALYPKWAHLLTSKGALGRLGIETSVAPVVLYVLIIVGEFLILSASIWAFLAVNGIALASLAAVLKQKP